MLRQPMYDNLVRFFQPTGVSRATPGPSILEHSMPLKSSQYLRRKLPWTSECLTRNCDLTVSLLDSLMLVSEPVEIATSNHSCDQPSLGQKKLPKQSEYIVQSECIVQYFPSICYHVTITRMRSKI